jgi:hypothetical protein
MLGPLHPRIVCVLFICGGKGGASIVKHKNKAFKKHHAWRTIVYIAGAIL